MSYKSPFRYIPITLFLLIVYCPGICAQQTFFNTLQYEKLAIIAPNYINISSLIEKNSNGFIGILSNLENITSGGDNSLGYQTHIVSFEKQINNPSFERNKKVKNTNKGIFWGGSLVYDGSDIVRNISIIPRLNFTLFFDPYYQDEGISLGINAGFNQTRFNLNEVQFLDTPTPAFSTPQSFFNINFNIGASYFINLGDNSISEINYFSFGGSMNVNTSSNSSTFELNEKFLFNRVRHFFAYLNYSHYAGNLGIREYFLLSSFSKNLPIQLEFRCKQNFGRSLWLTGGISTYLQEYNNNLDSFGYFFEFGVFPTSDPDKSLSRLNIGIFTQGHINKIKSILGNDVGFKIAFIL